MNKVEVDMLIGILKSILLVVETVDPKAAENKVVIEINNVITTLQALGI